MWLLHLNRSSRSWPINREDLLRKQERIVGSLQKADWTLQAYTIHTPIPTGAGLTLHATFRELVKPIVRTMLKLDSRLVEERNAADVKATNDC